MENCLTNARLLSRAIEASGWYICISDVHRRVGVHHFTGTIDVQRRGGKKAVVSGAEGNTSADYNAGLPVVAFRLSDTFKKDFPHVKQESVSTLMRVKQYIIPSKQSSAMSFSSSLPLIQNAYYVALVLRLPPTPHSTGNRDPPRCCQRKHVARSFGLSYH